jgi:AcrR family transcriptional regulator
MLLDDHALESIQDAPGGRQSPKPYDAIVRAATVVFSDKGFEGASLRDIARAASIPLSTLNHYFPQKLLLQEAAISRAADIMTRETQANFLPGEEGDNWLLKSIRTMTALLSSNRPEMRLIDREFQSLDDQTILDIAVRAVRNSPAATISIAQLFDRTESGVLKHISSNRLVELLFSFVYGATKLRRLHSHGSGSHATTSDKIAEDIWILFDRALAPIASESDYDRKPTLDKLKSQLRSIKSIIYTKIAEDLNCSEPKLIKLMSGSSVGALFGYLAKLHCSDTDDQLRVDWIENQEAIDACELVINENDANENSSSTRPIGKSREVDLQRVKRFLLTLPISRD